MAYSNTRFINFTVRQHLFYLVNIIFSLAIGVSVYVFFRPDTHISQVIYRFLGVRPLFFPQNILFPEWLALFIRNYLADILWAYALSFTVCYILWHPNRNTILSFAIVSIFEICMEVFQKTGFLSGTFDWLDIFYEICISAFAMLYIKKHIRRSKYAES